MHMSQGGLTATPETSVKQIAEAMLSHHVHSLPIVNSDHQIGGIITSTDLLRAIVQNAPIELWA